MKFSKDKIIILVTLILLVYGFNHSYYSQLNHFQGTNISPASYWNLSQKIHINNNWSATASLYEWCSGSGTYLDPYVISNVTIDGKGAGNCVLIESTSEYFKIENSILSNAGTNQGNDEGGIKLKAVRNAYLINNTISNNNDNGVVLSGCNNITLESNVIEDNYWQGVLINDCSNLIISQNIINENYYGLIVGAENSIIMHNSVANNVASGIDLRSHLSNSSQIFITGKTMCK